MRKSASEQRQLRPACYLYSRPASGRARILRPKQFICVLFFSAPYAEVKVSTASPDDRVSHGDRTKACMCLDRATAELQLSTCT